MKDKPQFIWYGLYCKYCSKKHVFISSPSYALDDIIDILQQKYDSGQEYEADNVVIFIDKDKANKWEGEK
jgi:hypothetical protein